MTRNTLMFALKLVVSISIFAALFVMFDLAEVWSRLKIHSFSYLGLALCGFLALLVSNAFRWWVILCAIRIDLPFAFTLKLQYIAAFFNQALPSVIGGDAIQSMGFEFVLYPVLINALIILTVAVVFNFPFSWRKYPASRIHTPTAPQNPEDAYSDITHAEFVVALSKIDSVIDVSEHDLIQIYDLVTKSKLERESL